MSSKGENDFVSHGIFVLRGKECRFSLCSLFQGHSDLTDKRIFQGFKGHRLGEVYRI